MMGRSGGVALACAACKYQRRRCTPACPLAPYFPGNDRKTFLKVHRLFGVSNVTKIVQKLITKDEKDDAMKSIIYQAEMRERFPVHGCCYVIRRLQFQIEWTVEQLSRLNAYIAQLKGGGLHALPIDTPESSAAAHAWGSVSDLEKSFQIVQDMNTLAFQMFDVHQFSTEPMLKTSMDNTSQMQLNTVEGGFTLHNYQP